MHKFGKTSRTRWRYSGHESVTNGCGSVTRLRGWPTVLWVAGVLALSAGATPALSQESTLTLKPITVEGNSLYSMKPTEETGGYAARAATVGTKTPATLRSIPQSVSVVTRDVIEDRNFTTLDELARKTPGLHVLNNDDGRSSITARGYEYTEYNINGLPAPLASNLGSVPNLAAFDRVEILRGPSGLFNATSAMGGIINLVLKKPTDTFQGHVIGRYGSWAQYFTALDVSGPLGASGDIRGRFVAAKKGSDGFPEGNEVGSSTVYGTLAFDLSEDTLLSLSLLRQAHDLVPNNGVPLGENGDLVYSYTEDTFFGAGWNHFENESYDVIAELTHAFDNGGHGHIGVRYSDREGSMNYIYAAGNLNNGKAPVRGLGRAFDQTALSVDAYYSQTFDTFGNASEFVVGADYKHYEKDVFTGVYSDKTGYTADGFGSYPYVDILAQGRGPFYEHAQTEAYGLYSKLTFRPLASLALIGGARISTFEVSVNKNFHGTAHDSRSETQITPYAGAVYDLGTHHSLYASYSKLFEPQTATKPSGELFKPREGEQYELGIKSSYFAGALNTRVTLFSLTDKHTPAAVPGHPRWTVPVGEREVRGLEVELTGSPTPNWDIIFGYTYLDTEIKTDKGDRHGRAVFMLMPENSANLWAQYHFTGGPLNGLRVGAGVTAVGEFKSASTGVEAPGYVVVDAMVGYEFTNKLSAQININNVLDEAYYTRVGSKGTFNMRGEPLNAMLSVRYDF